MNRLATIPEGSIEVQTGLWAYLRSFVFNGVTKSHYVLYSAEGYCFYCPAENIDEDGNLLPENERVYAQYRSTTCTTVEQINARFVSVPVQDGYDILGGGGDGSVTA